MQIVKPQLAISQWETASSAERSAKTRMSCEYHNIDVHCKDVQLPVSCPSFQAKALPRAPVERLRVPGSANLRLHDSALA